MSLEDELRAIVERIAAEFNAVRAEIVATDVTPPTGMVLTVTPDQTELDVSWTAATDDRGVIDRYEMQLDSGSWSVVTSPQTVSGLTESTAYTVRVRAYDPAGNYQEETWSGSTTGSLFVATDARTVFMGDSVTLSDGSATGDRGTAWPNIAAIMNLGRTRYYQNRGVGGETVSQMASRFASQVTGANPKPGIVVIMGGTNDHASGAGDTATTMTVLDGMVQDALTAGIQPILCAPPPTRNAAQSAKLKTLRNLIAAYTDCQVVVDTYDRLVDVDDLLLPSFNGDGIHPNSLGLHELGDAFADEVPTTSLPAPLALSTVARPSGTLVASGIDCLASVDSNSDGRADGIVWAGGSAPGSSTASLVAGAPGGGNWQRVNINISGWSQFLQVNFDLSSVATGARVILACRMRWNATGQIGLNCYYNPLPNGFQKVIANDSKRHYPWDDGAPHIEIVKAAGENSASFRFNGFPGTGTLDITQFTGYVLS